MGDHTGSQKQRKGLRELEIAPIYWGDHGMILGQGRLGGTAGEWGREMAGFESPVRRSGTGSAAPSADFLPAGGGGLARRVPGHAQVPPGPRRSAPGLASQWRLAHSMHFPCAHPGRVVDGHPRGRDEALEAGHEPGRQSVGPLRHLPRPAEAILELDCGVPGPDALSRVNEPAETRKDAEQQLVVRASRAMAAASMEGRTRILT